MPITEAKAREWAGIDPVSQIFPILLHCCLTVADMREMLPIILAFAHLFIPGGEHAPPFAHLAEEFPGVKLCADALVEYEREKILDMASARWPTTLAFGNSKQSEKSFITAISHTEGSKAKVVRTNRMEPFMQLTFNPLTAPALQTYVDNVVAGMLRGTTEEQHFKGNLFIGARSWESATAWARAKTVLEAIKYEKWIANNIKFHAPHLAHTLGHSHTAMLTARQARRSGVRNSEGWRRRWD